MKIDRETLDKMAHLARLEFDEKDAARMMSDMTEIVNWVSKLDEVDTTGVEPLTTMSQEVSTFRDDEPRKTLTREEVMKNSPTNHPQFFRVPKMIE